MKNSTDQNAKVYQKGTKNQPEKDNNFYIAKYTKKITQLNFHMDNTYYLYFYNDNFVVSREKMRKTILKVEKAKIKLKKKIVYFKGLVK
jgi:hypothetical protein